MNKLDEIKKEIGVLGVRRATITNQPDIEKMKTHFYELMEKLLATQHKSLETKGIDKTVDKIISWSYMTGEGIDYNKGFFFKGNTGGGKTFLFKVWAWWLKLDHFIYYQDGKVRAISPQVVNVKRISGEYQDPTTGGYRVIERYGRMHCLVLDDIGKEDDFSLSYGNKVNIIEEIINLREESGMLTFGTTNLNKLSDKYDDRTISRMNRLFTAIPITHNIDFRLR